jgi:outer membrane protein assembly factor BamB
MRAICVCLLLGAAALAADTTKETSWPLFRGNPEQTGVARTSLPDTLKVLWQFSAKDGIEGTAAITGGTVFIGSFDKHLYALDLKTGKEKWKYGAGPIKATPGYRDGVVYAGDEDGTLHAVDAATGKRRWTFEGGSDVVSGISFAGTDILFGTEGSDLVCVSKDGKKRWTFNVPGGPVYATAAVVEGSTFLAGCDVKMHVIDTKTGMEARSIDLAGQVGATTALAGDLLYVGTMTNEIQAVNWKKGTVVWTYRPEKRAQSFQSSVALTDALVIAGSKDRRVHAVNRKTGEPVWTFTTENRVDSSPVVVGKRVYIGSLDSKLYVLDRDKGTLIQKLELDGEIIGSPAVADGRLVIATVKGTVYCLGE